MACKTGREKGGGGEGGKGEERQAKSGAVEGREGTGGGGGSKPWLKRKPINERIGQTIEK